MATIETQGWDETYRGCWISSSLIFVHIDGDIDYRFYDFGQLSRP
jgi:hypothetical protein